MNSLENLTMCKNLPTVPKASIVYLHKSSADRKYESLITVYGIHGQLAYMKVKTLNTDRNMIAEVVYT